MLATDYPFGPEKSRGFMRSEVETVEAMDVSEQVREKVLGRNVAEILRTIIDQGA